MRFVALVSGGKDSCFNILHCLNAGHELVAMANLRPKADRPDEIDSWMFQTVGHQAVEALATCAEVPLFRSEISEDEDAVVLELTELFTKIRTEIDFDGISVGAIASTYQQVRVDRACSQLGLRSLSYLWQRDQRELLQEINRSGMDVRVIKVAGQSLGEHHLGKTLSEIEADLLEKNQEFGLHPCGEGGEYETMVFDAPFFKSRRMKMEKTRVVHHSTDDVFYLDFSVELATKHDVISPPKIKVPAKLEPQFEQLLRQSPLNPTQTTQLFDKKSQTSSVLGPRMSIASFSGDFAACFSQINAHFQESSKDLRLAFHVVVLLKDMAKFADFNALYSQLFSKAAPALGDVAPSRACVQANIDQESQITIFYTPEIDRSGKGIHVQGLSYWAPASIGPYSQCRLVHGISYVAGQIGLVPQSLELECDVSVQAVLALQHATRVLDVIHEHSTNWTPRLAIVWLSKPTDQTLAEQIWQRYPRNGGLPLICVVVDVLPRGARFEWSLQGCDSRYFAWYIPENDSEDELYSTHPEILRQSSKGYLHRAGFQTLEVSTQPSGNSAPKLRFSRASMHDRCSESGKTGLIPVKKISYNGEEVNQTYVYF